MPTIRTDTPEDSEWLTRYLLRLMEGQRPELREIYEARIREDPQSFARLSLGPKSWTRMQAAYRNHLSHKRPIHQDIPISRSSRTLLGIMSRLDINFDGEIEALAVEHMGAEAVRDILAKDKEHTADSKL